MMMATLVSNSMGWFEALGGGHFGMVGKVKRRRDSGTEETNVLR